MHPWLPVEIAVQFLKYQRTNEEENVMQLTGAEIVITALPTLLTVTVPVAETFATLGLLEVYETAAFATFDSASILKASLDLYTL